MNKSVCVFGLAALSFSSAHAAAFGGWNLVVANDLTFSSSEVDGSAIIGGNLLGGTSNYSIRAVTAVNGTGLAIGGSLAAGATVNINNSGDFRIGNTADILGTANVNGGQTIQDASVAATAASLIAQAQADSAFLGGLNATGVVDGAGNINGNANTMIGGLNVAIFDLTQTQVDSGLGQLNLNMGSADTVIINYSTGGTGAVDLSAPPNLIGGFNQQNSARILWNFVDATAITINNNFNGTILAPDATLSVNGGGINGSVVVDSILVQDAEIRLNLYTGFIPSPSASALFGCAGLLALRRRRA
ncbi:MAG: choice-of-anchor A family protein [Planctomycetota bacterium]